MSNIASYLKNHISLIVYSLFGLMTAALAAALLTWTVMGSIEREIKTVKATLVSETPVRTEYLVGQTFAAEGAYLNIGTEKDPQNIPFEDCTVTADFTSAGRKAVSVSYMYNEYTNYEAIVYVNVLFVRSLQIETYPRYIEVTDDGALFSEDFEAYVELAQKPQTDVFGATEKTQGGYRARVNENMYTVSCKDSPAVAGYYDLSIYCGEVSASFSFFNLKDRSLIVDSLSDVVQFENAEGAGAGSMTLVVTDRDDSYQTDCTGKTSGYYVYDAADGAQTVLPFAYELSDKEELLASPSVEERVMKGGDGSEYYSVEYGGKAFTASASVFRTAVVGGMIVEDHGYKLVIDSDKRILRFTYAPSDPTDPTDPDYNPAATAVPAVSDGAPTLTLYVTDYDMNPLLGTGNGWSRGVYIYTNADGESYKIPFYMQAWVWTYVPLSSGYGDVYSDVTVNDFVYNHEAPAELRYNSYYRGTMYANITCYDRGNGFVNDRFVVPDVYDGDSLVSSSEDFWVSATMGM